MTPEVFDGFRPEALRFLAGLGGNNTRDWFHAHRDEYESLVLEPARDFVVALGDELREFAPDVNADPRVNGSIFRIARDTRFSKDKRPYKDHLDLWFWIGDRKRGAGFWFRLAPSELILGSGMHHFDKAQLERYRQAVADRSGAVLQRDVERLRAAGYELGGRRYKRQPAGFEAPAERAELLLHDGVYGWIQTPVPEETFDGRFPSFCANHYRRLAPLNEFLAPLA
jgi:uncharacterized protein (TIGR02453 family)